VLLSFFSFRRNNFDFENTPPPEAEKHLYLSLTTSKLFDKNIFKFSIILKETKEIATFTTL